VITWILIGAGIGFVLEGAGFGNAKKLTGVFVLKDWSVPIVMMTAILTAMAVALVLGSGSWFTPETRYLGQALGGFIFGVGFFVGGYCPGTAVVGLASGRLDSLAFMGGLVGGWYLWDLIRTHLGDLLAKADVDTLPALLGAEPRIVAAIFVLAGGAGLYLVQKALTKAHKPA